MIRLESLNFQSNSRSSMSLLITPHQQRRRSYRSSATECTASALIDLARTMDKLQNALAQRLWNWRGTCALFKLCSNSRDRSWPHQWSRITVSALTEDPGVWWASSLVALIGIQPLSPVRFRIMVTEQSFGQRTAQQARRRPCVRLPGSSG